METIPYIINLTPKGAAAIIEGLADKYVEDHEYMGDVRYETNRLRERTIDLEGRLQRLEKAAEKEADAQ